jgi:hypothetical protein
VGLDHQGIHRLDMLIQKYVWNVLFKKREEWLNIRSSRGGGLGRGDYTCFSLLDGGKMCLFNVSHIVAFRLFLTNIILP